MSLEKRTYSVLLISAAQKFNTAISSLLPESKYSKVRTVSGISAARQSASEYAFDFIIINSPLPDDAGIRFAIDSARLPGTVVLFLVRAELRDEISDKIMPHGVFLLTETDIETSRSYRARLAGQRPGAPPDVRKENTFHRGKDGRNPPGQQSQMDTDRQDENG